MIRFSLPLTLLLAVLVACGPAQQPDDPAGSLSGAIVNGQKESGWPAAGALVADLPFGYMGSFCSGTLIAPRWVLTAGHCVSFYEGMPLMPQWVKFYVGQDARGSRWGGPSTGEMYAADMLVPHPDYDPEDLSIGSDIGLVRLAKEVKGVEPLDINTGALAGKDLTAQVLYVGFGNSDGINQTGSGLKRSTHMPITWIDADSYYTEPQGSGTCYGDSGGPGILEMAPGEWKVMGVVSAGTEPPGEEDPCLSGFGIYTRVDAYASWIADVTGIELPDCNQEPLCVCGEACQPDFSCDNAQCYTMSCSQALQCMSLCPAGDAGCSLDCRMATTLDAQVEYDVLSYCLDKYCTSAGDSLDCATQQCSKSLDPCLDSVMIGADCVFYDGCRRQCDEGNTLCLHVCEVETDQPVRDAWGAAAGCLEQKCGLGTDPEALAGPCAREQCWDEVNACFPAPDCDLLGGSCPEGMACVVVADGSRACLESGGVGLGEACLASDPAACADGLACLGEGDEATCRRLCVDDGPCGEGEICLAGAVASGYCGCWGEACLEAVDPTDPPPDGDGDTGGRGCSAGSSTTFPWVLLAPLALLLVRPAYRRVQRPIQ